MAYNFSLAVPYTAVAASGAAYLELKTPDTGSIKLKAAGYSAGAFKVELVEAPTFTTGTTVEVAVNHDRESTVKSAVLIKSDPTAISLGTILDTCFSYELDPTEYTLMADTTYIVKVLNMDEAAQDMTILIDYVEDKVVYEYDVVFTVEDELGAPVEDAYISCAGEDLYTDEFGEASITLRPNGSTYSYTVNAVYTEEDEDIPYIGVASTVAVVNDDVAVAVEMVKYVAPEAASTGTISFRVLDESNVPIAGASVTLGLNEAVLTNASGIAVFAEQTPAEAVTYSIEKTGYTTATGDIDIEAGAATVSEVLVRPRYKVTFTVTLDEDPVDYCRVDFRGYTQRTNKLGVLAVTNVLAGTYAYTAMYNGGYYVADTVTVTNADVAVAVALSVPVVVEE